MVAKAIAKVILLKEEKRYDEALEEINLAGKELLGDDYKTCVSGLLTYVMVSGVEP